MNKAIFQQAQNAYENNDFARALDLYNGVASDTNFPLIPGEYGLLFHQIGNCFVKLGNYSDAISAYINATNDNAYVSIGTVYYNIGMAYAYMNDFGNAISNFQTAINTPNYRSKYKAYTAMGNALMKSGKPAEAGAVFRNAALDQHNPDPTRALLNLGVCFMALRRSADAIAVYESAFQFNMSSDLRNRLYANLGQAYVASGQMQNAVNAFENALRDKTYVLSDSASVDYQKAIGAVSKGADSLNYPMQNQNAAFVSGAAAGAVAAGVMAPNNAYAQDNAGFNNQNNSTPFSNSEMNNTFDNSYDGNIDHTFDSGEVLLANSPVIDDEDEFDKWVDQSKEAAYNPSKKRHPVKIILIILLCLVGLSIIAGAILYVLGFGFPTQEMVINDLFSNPIEAINKDYTDTLSDSKKSGYSSMITQDKNPRINGIKRSVNESYVYVTGTTKEGGEIEYKIRMIRDIIGWKVSSIDLAFASRDD